MPDSKAGRRGCALTRRAEQGHQRGHDRWGRDAGTILVGVRPASWLRVSQSPRLHQCVDYLSAL